MTADTLAGKVIAILEGRELEVFASLLERRGARVIRCPLVRIIDAPDAAAVREWLQMFIAGGCDDLVLLTGEGLRRLHALAVRLALDGQFLSALGRVRLITRGPKPARALRELGLASHVQATTPTTAGVIDALAAGPPLAQRRIGVQLYGEEPNLPLMQFLRSAGALVQPVAPYSYVPASGDERVALLLQELAVGAVDAVAFTSKSQVQRLFAVAPAARIREILGATHVAAIGPVVAEELRAHGIDIDAMPASSWFMKPLTSELEKLYSVSRTSAAAD